MQTSKKRRAPNNHYNRGAALEFVSKWSEKLFRRQFRLPRCEHDAILESLKEQIRPRNVAMAELSAGSTVGVQTKLLVTLRILAGAMALDMIWYGVPTNHVDTYVKEVLGAMQQCSLLKNIVSIARTETEVNTVRAGWVRRQLDSNGVDLLEGTMYAVDGLVTKTQTPTQADVEKFGVAHVDVFRNYKVGGCGIVSQFACDAYCEFAFAASNFTGNTNDHIAFETTLLHQLFKDGVDRHNVRVGSVCVLCVDAVAVQDFISVVA